MRRILQAVGWTLARLPDKAVSGLAWGLAVVAFDILRLRRRLVLDNLTQALGPSLTPAARIAVGRRSVYHFVLTSLDLLRSAYRDIASNVVISGAEHLRTALAQRRGVLLVSGHLGNWEALGAALTRHICPTHVAVKTVGPPAVDAYIDQLRNRNGLLTIKRGVAGAGYRAIRRTLQKGEAVGFMLDQARPTEPRLPFFGRPAKTNLSLAGIYQRWRCPVLPVMIERVGPFAHALEVFAPLELSTAGDDAELYHNSTCFNAAIEKMVRRAPEQYFWLHDRWKD